jgi:hypothetical protein
MNKFVLEEIFIVVNGELVSLVIMKVSIKIPITHTHKIVYGCPPTGAPRPRAVDFPLQRELSSHW